MPESDSILGGTNPALRTFYYRLLRLISLSIHPLFVFDGPNRPPFKRNKRTGPNVASVPDFLAKQLLKQFGLPFHIAPGEAEAECALLQRKEIVDAVLSEDVDTLMFGSGLTVRNYSAEGKGSPTHVSLYDALATKETAGLDREGMILVALMSGGDYVPEGVPGVGAKTACQAARAGFGKELCAIGQTDHAALATWKERLRHEIATNESKYFSRKYGALNIPDDFPRRDVLRYYTHPCLSSNDRLDKLKRELKWDQVIDFNALRTFTGEAFGWICVSGAKKFIRNLAPALLVKQLRIRGESGAASGSDDPEQISQDEDKLVKSIDKVRNHVTTDGTAELKVGFIPHDLVPIDLAVEDPDPELPLDDLEDGDEDAAADEDEPGATQKKRGPYLYDPDKLEKVWVLETYVKVGVPLKIQDWEESFRNARRYEAMKAQKKLTEKRHGAAKRIARGGMPRGALDCYAMMVKPGVAHRSATSEETQVSIFEKLPSSQPPLSTRSIPDPDVEQTMPALPRFRVPPSSQPAQSSVPNHSIISKPLPASANEAKARKSFRRSTSETPKLGCSQGSSMLDNPPTPAFANGNLDPLPELPSSVTTRRQRSPLRRTRTLPASRGQAFAPRSSSPKHRKRASASSTQIRDPSASRTPKRRQQKSKPSEVVSLLTSSPALDPATPSHSQRSIADWLSPSRQQTERARPGTNRVKGSEQADPEALFWPEEKSLNPRPSDSSQLEDSFLEQGLGDPESRNLTKSPIRKRKSKAREPLAATTANSAKAPFALPPSDRQEPKDPQEAAREKKTFRSFRTSGHSHYPHPSEISGFAPTTSVDLTDHASKPSSIEHLPPAVTKLSKVLRLRDSLPGTYALEVLDLSGDHPNAAASGNVIESAGAAAVTKRKLPLAVTKPKRKGASAATTKRWRVSQVEVLDLTGS